MSANCFAVEHQSREAWMAVPIPIKFQLIHSGQEIKCAKIAHSRQSRAQLRKAASERERGWKKIIIHHHWVCFTFHCRASESRGRWVSYEHWGSPRPTSCIIYSLQSVYDAVYWCRNWMLSSTREHGEVTLQPSPASSSSRRVHYGRDDRSERDTIERASGYKMNSSRKVVAHWGIT